MEPSERSSPKSVPFLTRTSGASCDAWSFGDLVAPPRAVEMLLVIT